MLDCISVGLLGLGTVGTGVIRIIENHQEQLSHQIGCPIIVKKVLVQNVHKERAIKIDPSVLTTDPNDIINNPEIDVVIEVIGGVEPTKEWLIQALRNKKHIVTANKDLLALHGPELLKIAKANGCDLFYEASVAGGIPLLRTLAEGLASDRITRMMGIVNGTTNYILTKMSKGGTSYEVALQEAQAKGFAEADPTADVEGLDAARKMAILAGLGFSTQIELADVKVKGITSVTESDIEYAKQFGYTIKLIGIADRKNEKIEVSVEPVLLPLSHPLSSVNDEYNAVFVYGEAVGKTMFFGPGAGSLPTATSVVSDLVAVMKNMRLGVNGTHLFSPQYEKCLKRDEEIILRYFIRLLIKDEVGSFAQIATEFANHGISLKRILQHPIHPRETAEIVVTTHRSSLANFEKVFHRLESLGTIQTIKSIYRIEGEDE
nr:homoserine dehydrogenase [Rubeoparvulum massiliense]